eukprot:1067350-Amphidinium_carterae.1
MELRISTKLSSNETMFNSSEQLEVIRQQHAQNMFELDALQERWWPLQTDRRLPAWHVSSEESALASNKDTPTTCTVKGDSPLLHASTTEPASNPDSLKSASVSPRLEEVAPLVTSVAVSRTGSIVAKPMFSPAVASELFECDVLETLPLRATSPFVSSREDPYAWKEAVSACSKVELVDADPIETEVRMLPSAPAEIPAVQRAPLLDAVTPCSRVAWLPVLMQEQLSVPKHVASLETASTKSGSYDDALDSRRKHASAVREWSTANSTVESVSLCEPSKSVSRCLEEVLNLAASAPEEPAERMAVSQTRSPAVASDRASLD